VKCNGKKKKNPECCFSSIFIFFLILDLKIVYKPVVCYDQASSSLLYLLSIIYIYIMIGTQALE